MKAKCHCFASLVLVSLAISASGQHLSPSEKNIVSDARAKYYNLQLAGFQSLSCAIAFDLSTLPVLRPTHDDPIRKVLEATQFTLGLDLQGRPTVQHQFPVGTDDFVKQNALQELNLLTSLVMGVFQTWPSKGLYGPIPPFDSQIAYVVRTDQGYRFSLNVPGAPVEVLTDSNYVATQIVSSGGILKEHPVYTPSPQGLLLASDEALEGSPLGNSTAVRYEIQSMLVNGLRVPGTVRLRVKPEYRSQI